MERTREAYWLRYPETSPLKLRWRALTVRHAFHVLPGETVLELGAGSGLWTTHLTDILKGENPITACVFNHDLASRLAARRLPNVEVLRAEALAALLDGRRYDYVVGTAILCHDRYAENLELLQSILKPGGQLLFFEANYWNPQVFLKTVIPALGQRLGEAACQTALRKYRLLKLASEKNFVSLEIVPYDIVHPRTPLALLAATQSLSYLVEHLPGIRELCGTLFIWARKPAVGEPARPKPDLAQHRSLARSVSVVVPCHNEAMNVRRLVDTLFDLYGAYLHEVIVVDDNSTDGTAAATERLAAEDARVRLVSRGPPPGVGRALRDGYRVTKGRYVLTLDCDFFPLAPELRDLFDVIAAGHDGAMGSRFSRDSILMNYPATKILGNRAFHLLARLLLGLRVRDASNNLKLMRGDILRQLEIEEGGFAANAETGLKPLLAGHDIREVPMSWVGRTSDMGASTFRTAAVAPGYARVLYRLIRGSRHPTRHPRLVPPGDGAR